MPHVTAPSDIARCHAARRLAALVVPPGALGRLGALGIWLAACQVPPNPVDDVRLVIFAGDHGVATDGVPDFPSVSTAAMVCTFLARGAAVNALAAVHAVLVRVLDLGAMTAAVALVAAGLGIPAQDVVGPGWYAAAHRSTEPVRSLA